MSYRYTTPIDMPRGTHYGSNYWVFESRKLHRRVTAFSNLEYENLLTLEMDPNVEHFCEQPTKEKVHCNGTDYETVFDVYVVYKDGKEEIQEVKYQEELNSDTKQGERSRNQVALQKIWCLQNNLNYEVRTDKDIEKGQFYIRNLSVLSAKARRFNQAIQSSDNALISYFKSNTITTIGELIESEIIGKFGALEYVSDLYYRGIINLIDLENKCLSNNMEVMFRGE